MRLHSLKVTGIGPYAGSEEIDFDRLGQAGVHLLTGPTGAGKTTVLDAIAFALFGEVPRTSKGAELVSAHRELGTTPEVVLEATIGGARLRVTRSPAHLRPAARGTGTANQNQSVRVERREDGEWRLLTDSWREGNADLEDRIGMDADQFSQVVMLPQGEFARFLRADVKARQQLLERLFPGNDLTYVESWLKQRAIADAGRRSEKQEEIETRFHRIGPVLDRLDPDEDGQRPMAPDLAEPGPALEWIARLGQRLDREATIAEAEQATAQAAAKRADDALNELRKRAESVRQRIAAEGELSRLEAHADWRRQVGEEIAAAERAAKVTAIIRRAEADEREAEAAAAIHEQARAELAADPEAGEVEAAELERLLPAVRAEATTIQNFERDDLPRRRSLAARAKAIREDREALSGERPDGPVARASAAHDSAVRARAEAQARYVEIRASRTRSMAAELATELVAGEPCAVCGSTEHPTPADPSAVEFSREDEEHAERAVATATRSERQAREALEAARTEAARKLTALDTELKQAEAELAGLERRERDLTGTAASVTARREELERRAGLIARFLESGVRADDRRRAATAAREDATRTAEANGFDSLDEAKASALEDQALAARRRQATEHDEGLARVRGRLEGDLAEVDPGETIDLAPATKEAEAAGRTRDEKTGLAASAADRADTFHAAMAPVAGLYDELAPLREAAARSNEMSRLANGENERRMKLSIYVLAARLKQVIQAANHHLERMSNQRYELVYSGDLAGHGAASGLGIEVLDAYTSQSRPTSSLSGGESFYASLSLALGLAEVVQQEAGGRKLETLFIDEGFGTLDGKTLDQVMDVIDSLREGGRSVGLVSHVEELRNRIPAQIQVNATREGSTIDVVA